jgi:hypothetical protein
MKILQQTPTYERILSEFDKEITSKMNKLSQFEFLNLLRTNQTVEQLAK